MENIVTPKCIVGIHYTLRDQTQRILDSTVDAEPLSYLHGYDQIIPGLEQSLLGKKVGDTLNVVVDPTEGYGAHDPKLASIVDRKQFPKDAPIEENAVFEFSNAQGHRGAVMITKVDGDKITIDANHPLAGKQLFFSVEIVSIRKATQDELAQAEGLELQK